MKPDDNAKVHVIVTERPNRVWVVCDGIIHSARWRTSDCGDNLRDVKGDAGIIHAAMLAWMGQEPFTLTFAELEEKSQGYGAWDDTQDFTVTVAGPERHDGEKPYTYVVTATDQEAAGAFVLNHHKAQEETDDVLLVSVVNGVPPAKCGYYWNDLRKQEVAS